MMLGLFSPKAMHLPSSAQEFVRVIGLGLTLRLVDISRNWRIYIPARPLAEDHPIVQAVGAEAAAKLQKAFGGSMMPIGGTKAVKAHARNVEIAEAWLAGNMSLAEIGRQFNVSPRTVDRALGRVSTSEVRPPTPPGIGSFSGGPMRVARDTSTKA